MCSLLNHINLCAEIEQNPPHGFWDRPPSNCLATTARLRLWRLAVAVMTSSRARDVIARMTSRATSSQGPLGRYCSPEYPSFWIFQIGQLLRELWPFSWNHVKNIINFCRGESVWEPYWQWASISNIKIYMSSRHFNKSHYKSHKYVAYYIVACQWNRYP